MNDTIEALKAALPPIDTDGLKKIGKEYKGPCPCCGGDDRYYVRPDNTFGCRGCHDKIGDVIEYHEWRYGTSIPELKNQYLYNTQKINHKPLNGKRPKARAIPENLTETYVYKDAAGKYLFQVERYEEPGCDKSFQQSVNQGGEKVTPTDAGVVPVPYNLPGIINALEVFICEGEKDVNNLTDAGGIATTTPGGSSNFKSFYAEFFKGKHITILPDQDEPGQRYRDDVIKYCTGIAASIRVVNVPTGKDVSEYLDNGGTFQEILRLTRAAEEIKPPPKAWDSPVNIAAMMWEKPDPIPWLFTQRLPAGRGSLLTGLGGSSKTTTLYAMAVGACCGSMPWGWEVERTGKAVLVLTEDTAADVHHTIHYLSLGLTDEERAAVIQNLVIFPMAGKDTRLMVKTRNQTVEKSPLYFALEQKIHDLGNVVFVGLDPALSLSEGEELDQGQQRALGKMADDLGVNTGAAVLLVSHATKASLQTEELQSHSSRGGGAITDAVRAEYVLRNMTGKEAVKANITDIEERHRHVQLVNTKGNKIPPAARVPVWLRRDDFGNLAEVEIIFDEKGHFTDREKKIIQTHIEMSVHSTVKLGDWRAECVKRGLVSGDTPKAQEKAMQRVLKNLSNLQMIQKGIGKGIYTITDLGKDTQ